MAETRKQIHCGCGGEVRIKVHRFRKERHGPLEFASRDFNCLQCGLSFYYFDSDDYDMALAAFERATRADLVERHAEAVRLLRHAKDILTIQQVERDYGLDTEALMIKAIDVFFTNGTEQP